MSVEIEVRMWHACRKLWPFLWILFLWAYIVLPVEISTHGGLHIGRALSLSLFLSFTGLIIFHASLYILSLFRYVSPRRYWLYILIQCGLILLASGIFPFSSAVIISMSLYLAFIGEAVNTRQQRGPMTLTVTCAVLFFLLDLLLHSWIDLHTILKYLIPLLLVAIGYILFYFRLARAHDQTQELLKALEVSHHELVSYSTRVQELTLISERERMARELHDTLAQGLVGLTMQLDTVDALLTMEEHREAQEIVQQAMARARSVLAASRCAIDDLRNEARDNLDFVDAMQDEIARFRNATGIVCSADLVPLAALSPQSCEHILRVVAEGLMNIARYAQAKHAWVQTRQEEDLFVLEIRDDGIGFDTSSASVQMKHYGLLGLRERARLLQGSVQIESTFGKGTRIRFSVPLMKNVSV